MSVCMVCEVDFIMYDGEMLFYCYWFVIGVCCCGVIVLLYCGYEYLVCVVYFVDEFDLLEFVFFVWDVCGYGCLLGVCGYSLSVAVLVCDLQIFVEYICDMYGIVIEEMVVVGQSVGVVFVVIWVYDYVLLICVLVVVLLVFYIKFYVLFVWFGL